MASTKEESKDDDGAGLFAALCLCGPLVLCCVACALAPTVAYIVFGIMFLVSDQSVCGDYSYLWVYSIVALTFMVWGTPVQMIIGSILGGIEDDLDKKRFIGVSVTLIGLAVYGGVIIYGGYVCSDMTSHGLWTWALITFYLHLIFGVICLLLWCTGATSLHKGLVSDNSSSSEEDPLLNPLHRAMSESPNPNDTPVVAVRDNDNNV